MNETKLKDKWALVTGASSGFGADFARELASMSCCLILTARRKDRLGLLKDEISSKFGVPVKVMPMDLSKPDAPQQLYDQVYAEGISVDILINNAGFGIYGEFNEIGWPRQQEMLQLNILTVTHLTKLFLSGMVDRDFGYILNLASNSAYQPTPFFATYGGSKSYVLNFSQALNYELRHTNVSCTAVSPGPAMTGFQQAAGQSETYPYLRMIKMDSAEIAKIGIQAMLRGRASIVPGWKVNLMAWISQRAPRSLVTALTGWLIRL